MPEDSPIPEQPKDIEVGDIRTNDIQVWLNSLKTNWRTTRSDLDIVRAFLVYCRDALHALPPSLKTAAHIVPRPKPDCDAKPEPATVLSFVDVWRILINLQDLESVWFVALGVFAGLHQSEILRLVWEHDIVWNGDLPIQVFVPSGKGKDKHGNRLGVHVDVRGPLKSLLALGRGRTGRIVSRNYLREDKITPLVHRLKIAWDMSIMRHTFVSNLFGLGYSFEEVARQARNTVTVLKRHYYAPIPKPEAERFFSFMLPITRFSLLPPQVRCWDTNRIEQFELLKDDGYRITLVPSQPPTAVKVDRNGNPMKRVAWPDDLVLQVMIWETSQEQIARELGCRQTTVSSRAISRGLVRPRSDYFLRRMNGLPVEIPAAVELARKTLAARSNGTPNGNGGPANCNGGEPGTEPKEKSDSQPEN